MTAGSLRGLCVGQASSNYNRAELLFYYQGAGSAINRVRLGLYGIDGVSVWGNGFVGVNAGTTQPNAQLSVTGTFAASGSSALSGVVNTGTLSSTSTISGPVAATTLSASGSSALTGVVNTGTLSSTSTISGPIAASTLSASGATSLSGSLLVSGASTTTGVTNTGAITSNSLQVTTTASGQSGVKVYGPGSSGTTIAIDWSTYVPSGLPCWRWLLTDSGAGSSSLALQLLASNASSLSTALTFSSANGAATFSQPLNILGVDSTSRSLVSLASGSTQNALVWGQALSNNNSAALIYNNATSSTVFLGIYGSSGLTVDASGRVNVGTLTGIANGNNVATTIGNAYAAGTNTCLGFNTSGSYLSLVTVGVAGAWSNDANPGDSVVRVSGGQRLLLNANGGTGSSALACFNNNVGINNYSPAFALDVTGVVRASSQLNTTSNTSMVAPTVGTNGGSGDRFVLWPGSSSTYPYALGINNSTLWYNVPSSAGHSICVNGTVIEYINSSGVGIFNTSPAYALDVSGQGRLTSNGANQLMLVNTSTSNSNDACEIAFNRSAGYSSAVSAVGVGAGTRGAYWWVNGSDRVNINCSTGGVTFNNTVTVSGALTASAGASLTGTFNFPTSSGLTWGTGPYSKILDDGDLRICTDDNMHFYTGLSSSSYGTERITISSGNVGINQTSPSFQLDVNGTFRVGTSVNGSSGNWICSPSSGGYTQQYTQTSGTANGIIDWYSDVGAVFTNVARVTGNGGFLSKVNSYGTLSDRRLKKNIIDANGYLNKLNRLKVRKFAFNEDKGDGQTNLGFIADEVKEVIPGIVEDIGTVGEVNNVQSIKTSVMIPMLVKAVQELTMQVTQLRSHLESALHTNLP